MNWLSRQMKGLTFGALALAMAQGASAQDTGKAERLHLSVEQMQLAAELNLRNGNVERALAFADALLGRDAQDVTALLIRSHALRMKGEFSPAQAAARTAWRLADSDNLKFNAATLMAQSLSSEGKRTRAQLWLRRAREVAPTEQHAAQAAQDFRYVRQRNPWQTHLSFSLAPNSNINNGSANDRSVALYQVFTPLFGSGTQVDLGASSQALSGFEAGVDLQSRYRFHQTERTAHDLRMGLSYRTYMLSNSAQNDLDAEDADLVAQGRAPRDIKGSDYSYGTVQLGYGYKHLREDRRGEFSANIDLGQSFYGDKRYQTFWRAGLGQSYYASTTLKYTFGAEADIRRAQRGIDYDRFSMRAGMSRKLANGNGLFLGAQVSTLTSNTARAEYDELRLSSGYVLGKDIMGTGLQFGINTSFRDYDISPDDPSGRRDFTVGGQVTATFRQIEYLGFNPTLSLEATTTNSNIGRYDVDRIAVSVGIASSF